MSQATHTLTRRQFTSVDFYKHITKCALLVFSEHLCFHDSCYFIKENYNTA